MSSWAFVLQAHSYEGGVSPKLKEGTDSATFSVVGDQHVACTSFWQRSLIIVHANGFLSYLHYHFPVLSLSRALECQSGMPIGHARGNFIRNVVGSRVCVHIPEIPDLLKRKWKDSYVNSQCTHVPLLPRVMKSPLSISVPGKMKIWSQSAQKKHTFLVAICFAYRKKSHV